MDIKKRDDIVTYQKHGIYPDGSSENEKRVLRRASKSFVLKTGDVLYHFRERGRGAPEKSREEMVQDAQLVIVDENEKKRIIESMHSKVGGGHFGMTKTQEKIASCYWWPGCFGDVQEYIKHCKECQMANPNNRPEPATLHPIAVTPELGYHWCIDLVGPLHETIRENRYIVVGTEYLTRFATAKAIPTKDMETVGRFVFENIICMFSCPKIIQHDQGREFCNDFQRYMCEKLGIKKAISTAYHPQTNGLTERFNQTLVTQLMKVTNEKHNDWDLHIAPILFAYRVSVQSSTKRTPFEMLFGVKPHLPIMIDHPVSADADPADDYAASVEQRLLDISEKLVDIRNGGLQKLKKAQQGQKRRYDAKHQGTYYDIGDKVLKYDRRRNTCEGDKIKARYTGPYLIHEALGNGVYRIADVDTGNILAQKVNCFNLKRYTAPNETPKPKQRIDPVVQASIDENADEIEIIASRNESPKELLFKPISAPTMRKICNRLNIPSHATRRGKTAVTKTVVTKTVVDEPKKNAEKIQGDGNCLFRSLCHAISGTEEGHLYFRQVICDEIESNAQRYLGTTNVEAYVANMRCDKVIQQFTLGTLSKIKPCDTRVLAMWEPCGSRAWTSHVHGSKACRTAATRC